MAGTPRRALERIAVLDSLGPSTCALHGRRVPGARVDLDHVPVAPAGVFTIEARDATARMDPQANRLWVGAAAAAATSTRHVTGPTAPRWDSSTFGPRRSFPTTRATTTWSARPLRGTSRTPDRAACAVMGRLARTLPACRPSPARARAPPPSPPSPPLPTASPDDRGTAVSGGRGPAPSPGRDRCPTAPRRTGARGSHPAS